MIDEKVRQDFPIEWPDDHYVTRREFLKFLTMASGGLALGSVALAGWVHLPHKAIQFDRIRVASVNDVPVGGALNFSYPTKEHACMLVRLSETTFVAYSRRCTHLSCPVEYEPERQRLYCPCHNGAFSLQDGHVLQGPPPAPLPRIVLEQTNGELFAVGVVKAEGMPL